MARIAVVAPGCAEVSVELTSGDAILLGRDPDLPPPMPAVERVHFVSVESASVSANHAALWMEDRYLCVEDLASRNGTWLKLPRKGTVRVERAAAEELRLHLATVSADGSTDAGPIDAVWSGSHDFASNVATTVRNSLARRQINAEVVVTNRRTVTNDIDQSTRIPLATGNELHILVGETVDSNWPQILQQIWRFVSRQNLLFEAEDQTRNEGLILTNEIVRQAHRQLIQAASRSVRSVLITGPSGAGKEGMARSYHRHSGRSGPLVTLNCSMFNKELLRSELFGAEEGAFTGAVRRIIGAVERAHGGTLFLDEIGEMPADVQAMLLRFLDRGEYERLGHYGHVRTADVRVVCATNRDLRSACQRGEFRPDLWYRLSVVVIDLPPLRERPEDLAMFLRTRHLGNISIADALSPDAMALVCQHPWDGNFRELENFVERLPSAGRGGIDAAVCRQALEQGALVCRTKSVSPAVANSVKLDPSAWSAMAARAIDAYAADHDGATPSKWDAVKEYIEKYLKPLVFSGLAGIDSSRERADIDLQEVSRRLEADRGTSLKQTNRFFECYVEETKDPQR